MKIFIESRITSDLGIARNGKTKKVNRLKLIELIESSAALEYKKKEWIDHLKLITLDTITVEGLGDGRFLLGSDLT